MRLSVVLPAFNEARNIARSLAQTLQWFESASMPDSEIIVVDDGSRDDTAEEALKLARQDRRILVLPGTRNHGKGAAVRRGVRHSQGNMVLVSDADLATPINQTSRLIEALEQGNSIVVGNRRPPSMRPTLDAPPIRRAADWTTTVLTRVTVPTLLPISDVQSGFKLFRGQVARSLFELQTLDGYGYDAEILYMAFRRGYRIAEVPVEWKYEATSKVRSVDYLSIWSDLVRIRMNSAAGKYDG